MLLIDDLLLVHELADDVVVRFVDFERTRRQKDILEALVFASYGVLFGLYAFVYRRTILRANGRHLLVGAFAMFAVSVVIDFGLVDAVGIDIPDYRHSIDLRSLLEEGAKLVGIAYYDRVLLLVGRPAHRLPGGSATDGAWPRGRLGNRRCRRPAAPGNRPPGARWAR